MDRLRNTQTNFRCRMNLHSTEADRAVLHPDRSTRSNSQMHMWDQGMLHCIQTAGHGKMFLAFHRAMCGYSSYRDSREDIGDLQVGSFLALLGKRTHTHSLPKPSHNRMGMCIPKYSIHKESMRLLRTCSWEPPIQNHHPLQRSSSTPRHLDFLDLMVRCIHSATHQ